jgi:hypothetical protein
VTDCAAYMAVNTGVSCAFFALSLIMPLLHSILIGKAQNKIPEMTEILLKYSLFLNIGCSLVFSFIGESFYSAEMAECAGWAWSPFIYELAFSQLGLGVMGLLCALYSYEFWIATIIGSSIWLWGAAITHATDAIVHNNYAVGNMGFVFYWDLIMPVWIIGLYLLFCKATKPKMVQA